MHLCSYPNSKNKTSEHLELNRSPSILEICCGLCFMFASFLMGSKCISDFLFHGYLKDGLSVFICFVSAQLGIYWIACLCSNRNFKESLFRYFVFSLDWIFLLMMTPVMTVLHYPSISTILAAMLSVFLLFQVKKSKNSHAELTLLGPPI